MRRAATQDVVRPQHQLAVAAVAREPHALVDQPRAQAVAARPGLDQQHAQLRGLVVACGRRTRSRRAGRRPRRSRRSRGPAGGGRGSRRRCARRTPRTTAPSRTRARRPRRAAARSSRGRPGRSPRSTTMRRRWPVVERAHHGAHRAGERVPHRLGQRRQQLAHLPVRALVERAIELPARRGERQRLAPAVGRPTPCARSGPRRRTSRAAGSGSRNRAPASCAARPCRSTRAWPSSKMTRASVSDHGVSSRPSSSVPRRRV